MRGRLAGLVTMGMLLGAGAGFGQVAPTANSAEFAPEAVLRVMTRAADWQLAHPSTHAPYDWTQAAFYTGMMALADIAPDAEVPERHARDGRGEPVAARAPARSRGRLRGRGHLRKDRADRQEQEAARTRPRALQLPRRAALQRAARVGQRDRNARTRLVRRALHGAAGDGGGQRGDGRPEVPRPRQPPLVEDDRVSLRQGRAPLLPRQPLLRVDGTERAEGVLEPRQRLGDRRPRADAAGHATRLSRTAPATSRSSRRWPRKAAALQGADGYWRASLLDAASLPNPETSGTGFFIYSLAWGINHGVLDRTVFEPAVRRGWSALVKAVHPDGMLGWVQRIGDKPGATSQETTEVYGTGALLLAGSEVYRLK